jgi:heme oxygenase
LQVTVLDRTDAPAPGLIDRLRTETRDLHEALERDLDWKRRMATVEGYRGLLARWWGFHAVFEPLMDARPPLPGLAPRRKLHLLERDLSRLGMSADAIRALPRIDASSLPDDPAGMTGALYVLEGSTLGGLVIARHLRVALAGTGAEDACAYYQAYGRERTGPMWRAFLDLLASEVPHSSHPQVVAGACRTFAALRAWLPQECVPAAAPSRAPADHFGTKPGSVSFHTVELLPGAD